MVERGEGNLAGVSDPGLLRSRLIDMAARYSDEPRDPGRFTAANDRLYTRFASLYDAAVRVWPTWRRWLETTVPLVQGPRILEVSFGTGHLLTRYPETYETYGVDLNARLVQVARRNLQKAGRAARIQRARVEALPYRSEAFDTVVSTMAMSGYPDGQAAMGEMSRVLRPGGRLILVDVSFPATDSLAGRLAARAWLLAGDLIRDLRPLFESHGLTYADTEIGGFGTVHLYVGEKRASAPGDPGTSV